MLKCIKKKKKCWEKLDGFGMLTSLWTCFYLRSRLRSFVESYSLSGRFQRPCACFSAWLMVHSRCFPPPRQRCFSGQHQTDLSWRLGSWAKADVGEENTAASDGFEGAEGGRKTEPDGSERESGRATEHEAQLSFSLSLHIKKEIGICTVSKTYPGIVSPFGYEIRQNMERLNTAGKKKGKKRERKLNNQKQPQFQKSF